ncbi:glycosyltransferase family 4 protein [Venenivibrio stagnispumantis]|uniref:Glycosyltransferase involved in cell wall bisynthesis n=1 Tax=Venenivibrio stagnispumantis TaxID=407998 RepID=A0AA46AF48_9AQUI|nr:glycosyltransferase [Venenivibrio stagnispumantis]MCW4573208.1 glycosyltransferase [Venenivibrio stagnispumantis]SMP17356.1 Glycosyltransferase involved in cell wall bisynthesis [Venenivibrio stagnispumantis]
MNKKNILIITHYFPPMNAIGSLRPYSWAKYWSRMGHDVTVLTTKKIKRSNDLNFDISEFKVIEVENIFRDNIKNKIGYQNDKHIINKNHKITNLILIKLKTFFDSRGIISFDARFPNLFDFWVKDALNVIKNEKFDIVVSTYPPYANHLIALRYKKFNSSCFWVADYRDLWTQSHMFKGLFPFRLLEEYLERKINTTANLITTVSEPLANQLKEKYGISNVEIIENGFDLEDVKNTPAEKIWGDNKVRLVYTGSLDTKTRDPSPLFEAIRQIYNSNYKHLLNNLEVIFIGGGKDNLDKLILKYNVSKWVKHLGFLKREDSLRMQRDAHVVLFLEFEAENVDGILTGKLFEYLFSGTQIWGIGVTNKSAPGRLIEESGHGINFGKDVNKIKEHLINLLKSKEKPKFDINIKLLEKYTREYQAKKLLELIGKYRKNYINHSEL